MNSLAQETSPYLLQHAGNPVDWYPWGDAALARARAEGKPILLSIGYSACHWCHVMAHESFENEATAALMNKHFINIKVDREERPDLDKIYQLAHQLLTGRGGGWPLTLFLAPENQAPFFAGTYFPPEPRYGMPCFADILRRIAGAYREQHQEIRSQNEALIEGLRNLATQQQAPGAINEAPLNEARRQLGQAFDSHFGGFGAAPKFPHPVHIEFLLHRYAAGAMAGTPDAEGLEMALFTLRRMARGGIYDHLGGGFCRYSVDERWTIPHFEKMLYDNGPLLAVYSWAWQLSRDPLFKKTALETAEWSLREMQSPEGGFYSSLDADSEGHEGRFYVWDAKEIHSLLSAEEYSVLARCLGLDQAPNFEGQWHLCVSVPLETLAKEWGKPLADLERLYADSRKKLLAARARRIRPGRDEKVLTAWNGLMIKGLAVAGRVLGQPDFLDAAQRAVDFIRARMWQDGRLRATYKDGRARLNAYLDDHAFVIEGLLALLEARWHDGNLRFAIELAEALLARFEDPVEGGFFFTSHDHEALLLRSKSLADDALPSGAGIAAYALGRLGHLLGESRYLDARDRGLRSAWGAIERYPTAHNALLLALEEYLAPPISVVIRGDKPAQDWHRRCAERYAPQRLALVIPPAATELPGLLAQREAHGGAVAYLCEGQQCHPAIKRFEDFDRVLCGSEAITSG